MTPRQREAYIAEHQAKAAVFRDALLAAIAKYPGGMSEVDRKVQYHNPPTGGGLPELIRRLPDHRERLVTLQFFTVRQLCHLLNDDSFMDHFKGLWPEQYERGIADEAHRRECRARQEQEAAVARAARMEAAGIASEATFLDLEDVATRWGSVLVRFGTLCMTLGMKNDTEARAQAGRLVVTLSSLAEVLSEPGFNSAVVAPRLASLEEALTTLRKGPLSLAASDLLKELRDLKAALGKL